ncbi:MAG: hypothetical protein MJY98_03035 [Fibrobacter sp.]|nr:hypothetical protein [Fibrobacter sp.]
MLQRVVIGLVLCAIAAFAAPKSASAYYSDAAFQYIENRLPTAEITCNEGLQYYPNDQKLQMLLDRIHEAKDEQKNENKKKDPQNNQDQNQDQDNQGQNQDQNKDQQNQNGDQNQDQKSGESSSSQDEQQDQDQNGGGQSSDSQAQSSDSNGGSDQPQQPEGQSSDSQGEQPEEPQEVPLGQMSPEEASQLLKDFDEQNGERKPWKPARGQARPAKDW